MARKSQQEKPAFTIDYGELVSSVEKKFGVNTGTMDAKAQRASAVSTTLLGTDLMLGGGLLPGAWYTVLGGEQSAKSTHCMHMAQGAARAGIPIISYDDFEGSLDPVYWEAMILSAVKGLRFHEVFGVQDEDGNYVIKPKIRKREPDNAEQFFDPIASLLRKLPYKRFIKGRWFYAFKNTKENRKYVGDNYSKVLYSKYNMFFVEAHDGLPQAVFFTDSYPAMFPERLDEDDAGSGMAAIARMFAENVPKVLGKLKPKGATIVGVNQLRLRPGFNMGDPSYEPGGETIKFASSVRIRQTGRSVPHGKGPIEVEDSIGEGEDRYRYVHMKTIKNKRGTPYLEAWQRVWVSDTSGQAHGFDPVWDTFSFLRQTGQVTGGMNKMKVPLLSTKRSYSWDEFKRLILTEKADRPKMLKKLGMREDPKLRDTCFKQIRTGEAMKMMFDTISKHSKEE